MEINILIHGNSEGFNSEFMQYLSKNLRKDGKEICGFDFAYITNNSSPSQNLKNEIEQLNEIVKKYQNFGYSKINLIGKSLGGTICLDSSIIKNPNVNKVVIVGFPIILGFPADLSLLKIKPVVAKKTWVSEYVNAFEKIGKDCKKIAIIQGTNDLLGSSEDIESLQENLSIQLPIFNVSNASHGFKPINDTTKLDDNMKKIVEYLRLII